LLALDGVIVRDIGGTPMAAPAPGVVVVPLPPPNDPPDDGADAASPSHGAAAASPCSVDLNAVAVDI
jgi:hypothetical protein